MNNLIVYGSLLHPDELLKHNITLSQVEYVKVQGFRRVFNQEPSYRLVDSINRAVLNIEACKTSWFNALLIKGLSQGYFKELDEREKGYNRLLVNATSYQGVLFQEVLIYMGKVHLKNSTILPNLAYLDLCKEGAKQHGEIFYNDFINTTYVNGSNGLTLINT